MLTPTTPLADGAHSITTTLTDAAGNEKSPKRGPATDGETPPRQLHPGVTVTDDVAPVTGAIAANGASNDNKPTFAGAAGSDGRRFHHYRDGWATVLGTAVVAADGRGASRRRRHWADGRILSPRGRPTRPATKAPKRGLPLTVDTAAPAAPAAPTSTAPSTKRQHPGHPYRGRPDPDTPSLYVDGVKVPATATRSPGMLTPTTPGPMGRRILSPRR